MGCPDIPEPLALSVLLHRCIQTSCRDCCYLLQKQARHVLGRAWRSNVFFDRINRLKSYFACLEFGWVFYMFYPVLETTHWFALWFFTWYTGTAEKKICLLGLTMIWLGRYCTTRLWFVFSSSFRLSVYLTLLFFTLTSPFVYSPHLSIGDCLYFSTVWSQCRPNILLPAQYPP